MKMRILLICCACFIHLSPLLSQDKITVKFGKIVPQDFDKTIYPIDSNANAIVIAEIGNTEIVGNSKWGFSLKHSHFRRVHVLNKNGYDEADVEIVLFKRGDAEEEIEFIKAVTYNLENGKIAETRLDKNSVFTEKVDKNFLVKKFTFPNVKAGSIVEYEYALKSDFIRNLQPWSFQGKSPVLWSEYNLRLPEFYSYLFLTQGYQNYHINERKTSSARYTLRDTRKAGESVTINIDANVNEYRWVMKDVKALKEENFTSTLANHIARIEFHLAETAAPLPQHNHLGTWESFAEELLKDEDFGAPLNKNNEWLEDVVAPLTAGITDAVEKSKKIYAYVRDHFTCTSFTGKYLDRSLKNICREKNGTAADINLLLIAMLRHANLPAEPLILSTRTHGYAYSVYPIENKFNYVVCDIRINGKNFLLDASRPRLGFGKLPAACYNGHARIINAEATAMELSADSLIERKHSAVHLAINQKKEFEGSVQITPGYYESHSIREHIKEKGKEDFFKEIQRDRGEDIEITETSITSLDNLEDVVTISYTFKSKVPGDSILYIDPMFGQGQKQNPFPSAERIYPVEMPYTIDQTYVFSFNIPEGYTLDEMPGPLKIRLNENDDGDYEYRISETNGMISLRSRLRLTKAYYLPEEYKVLREFFNLVVNKQNQHIVLKKKNNLVP